MTGLRRRPVRWISIAIAIAWLAATLGCAGSAAPPVRTFRLVVAPPDAATAAPLLPGTLVVDRPRTDSLLAERAVLLRPTADSPELRQYVYSRWSDAPAALVQQAMVEAFAAARVAEPVLAAGLGVRPEWTATSRLLRLERVGGEVPTVDVELEVAWLRTAGRRLVATRRHRSTLDAGSDRIEDAVSAMGRALAAVLDEAVRELRGALAEDPPRARSSRDERERSPK